MTKQKTHIVATDFATMWVSNIYNYNVSSTVVVYFPS